MNGAHLHLLLNHFPIIGTYLSVLVLIAGYILKNSTVKNTGLGLLVVVALITIPTFLTGSSAAHVLKAAGQAGKGFIHEHAETADWGLWAGEITGALALFALYASIKNKKSSNTLTLVVTILSIITSSIFVKVGNTGGEIRHTEIRSGNMDADSTGGDESED